MYKNISKSLLMSMVAVFSATTYSANTIQFNGNIVEDTCFSNHTNKDCEAINRFQEKINTQSISNNDLNTSSQKNSINEISFEKLNDEKSAVIVASYY